VSVASNPAALDRAEVHWVRGLRPSRATFTTNLGVATSLDLQEPHDIFKNIKGQLACGPYFSHSTTQIYIWNRATIVKSATQNLINTQLVY